MHPGQRFKASVERGLTHVMASHSPLSARLAEEAGFDGIWASGFELSALYGVPDASVITMTQHLDMVRAMGDRTTLPIVADLDTGFGNAINVRHAVQQYERVGVAAVVIEDKMFPKASSLLAGASQPLVSTEEFAGKLAAAVDVRSTSDLLVIGRTEALIAGLGIDEALGRAHAYVDAGADLILVHSKQSAPDEIESFATAWDGSRPLVIVPTAYPSVTAERISAWGTVRVVIYGNHAIRACVTAMQSVFKMIREDEGIGRAHEAVVWVEEIFRLQGVDEMKAAEKTFLR